MNKHPAKKRFSFKGRFTKLKGGASKAKLTPAEVASADVSTSGTLQAEPTDVDVSMSPADTDTMSVVIEQPTRDAAVSSVQNAQADATDPGEDAHQRAESSSSMDVDDSTRNAASCEPSSILNDEIDRLVPLEPPETLRDNEVGGLEDKGPAQRDPGTDKAVISEPLATNTVDMSGTTRLAPLGDVADQIPGLYRILDLVSEQSSGGGGLVDKIIISQESFGRFANHVCPGAYQSMTNVNFRFLDTAQIKPLGIYGSRSEIVKYLQDVSAIDDEAAKTLRQSKDEMPPSQALRAGLYLLMSPTSELVHVLFWPQDTTWDDDAISSVQRNRITFMRYLTKIADQIVVLVSSAHANAMILNEQEPADMPEDSDDEVDRLFTFEVAKTKEEQENVTPLPGFEVRNLPIEEIQVPDDPTITPEMLSPQLVAGETGIGFMTSAYESAQNTEFKKTESYNTVALKSLISKGSFRLSESLPESALQILIKNGLGDLAKDECAVLREARSAAESRIRQERQEVTDKLNEDIKAQQPMLEVALRAELAELISSRFEVFAHEPFDANNAASDLGVVDTKAVDMTEARSLLLNLTAMLPELRPWREHVASENKFTESIGKAFKDLKEKILKENPHLAEQLKPVPGPSDDADQPKSSSGWTTVTKGVKAVSGRIATYIPGNAIPVTISPDNQRSKQSSESMFLARIPDIIDTHPDLVPQLTEAIDAARKHFLSQLLTVTHKAIQKIEHARCKACDAQMNGIREHTIKDEQNKSRAALLQAISNRFQREDEDVLLIEDVQEVRSTYYYGPDSYRVIGSKHMRGKASIRYTIRPLQVTTSDRHDMQLDPSHIPAPRFSDGSSSHFHLPVQHRIFHAQFVQETMLLLVTTHQGNISVYLENLVDLDRAIRHGRFKKQFRADKLGNTLLLSYDETKRMLAVCAVEKLQIHVFIFDERYGNLQGLGSTVDLRPWYDHQAVITHLLFRCGPDEELLIVDGHDAPRARIWSLTSQQFRPAALMLSRPPHRLLSSPDGSCFFTVELDSNTILQAYHWASFGSTQGIFIELPDMPMDSLAMCSLVNRSHPYFAALDYSSRQICSTGFHITHKSTEFTFKADRLDSTHRSSSQTTAHNSLLDVHRDVWIRFPVVPAVRRGTFKSSHRLPHSLTFVSSIPSNAISHYYSELVLAFEKSTRKPTDGELTNTIVSGITYTAFMKERVRDLSSFKAGEWLVDILCLIPIHIAVARDNRFVPLRDGVLTQEFERSLLGATVEQVVDRLSFGWYESIFQSYMASKPVQVVSSMGEQSVGKSFALNHLVDTSFAGSAMRTTEGVWMSVTPTDDTLIVALDFEGVHSLERSAQEDSLLVLFNTAISNLVLFRNNFAFSRDISGLFQSFQTSATVLDPAANPSLFKSLLVIIIKDVVDSDKNEITKEFSLKFQQIVASEQESNFISRLHGGKLAIIPWPVIESRQFYTLFQTVKKRLDKQPITHPKAGIFLQTLKTLMAKLKTNDWGSLDQNLATHRAQHLQALLPIALQFCGSEIEPDFEPLKDIDNGVPLDVPDVLFKFCLPAPQAPEGSDKSHMFLKKLQASWSRFPERQLDGNHELWTNELDEYLASLAADRIKYVRQWLEINTARFSSDTTTFEGLRRELGSLGVALRSTVQLCKLQCAECQLLCLKTRHHQGPHGCDTDHRCMHSCAFTEEHQGMETMCGLPAGHPGQHICDISLHLCGQPCDLYGKTGCLEQCSKIANHEDGKHMCPAPLHECGMACSLREIQLHDGSMFSCEEKCHIPSDQDHTEHVCKQQSCPLTCQLCRRLCSEPLHLHGLDNGARHLCGQEHPCGSLCQSRGICRIETAPQSVEVTFSGRHDTFQYTKYSQESKRLPCVVTIPSGETEHVGDHVHTMDPKNFHFCQTRCQSCGYFCTLPLDHAQQEHETSHGSMSQTKWAVEGADTSVIEVNGRRFGANDDGAPLLCSMICQELGRHAHIDYCRTQPGEDCSGNGLDHIRTRMLPQPEQPKDFISHELHWRRTGFKDPYPHEDRDEFAKCDRMCAGQEHQRDPNLNNPAQPSFCGLPIFHAELTPGDPVPGGIGYISGDGHHFSCRNPALLQQAFHVMFVIDRSGSMDGSDRRPLSGTPVTNRIVRSHNNRIGAVYSSLYSFWSARHNAINGAGNRRDAYSVILFDDTGYTPVTNNFTSTPDELLNLVLPHGARGGTDYNLALRQVQACMTTNWSTERSPVIIFLSDGLCGVQESNVRDLCRGAIALGRALSFHTVSFGPHNEVLRRMAEIALDVQRTAPTDPMRPALPSSYVEALDSVRLAETFLGIADSLAKPRGALMHA